MTLPQVQSHHKPWELLIYDASVAHNYSGVHSNIMGQAIDKPTNSSQNHWQLTRKQSEIAGGAIKFEDARASNTIGVLLHLFLS